MSDSRDLLGRAVAAEERARQLEADLAQVRYVQTDTDELHRVLGDIAQQADRIRDIVADISDKLRGEL